MITVTPIFDPETLPRRVAFYDLTLFPDLSKRWNEFIAGLLTFELEDNTLPIWLLMMPTGLTVYMMAVDRMALQNELPDPPYNPLDLQFDQA